MAARLVIAAPADEAVLAVVAAGLHEYNATRASLQDVQPLHVVATGKEEEVIGAAIGRTWGTCCELLQLWVTSQFRGQGEGSRLMDAFELEATERGCDLVYLDTWSFQAPAFYSRRGYVEVLRTAGYTGGAVKITMHKHLAGS